MNAHSRQRTSPLKRVERRGVQARGLVRRQLLLDAARRLLRRSDLNGINVADIAAEARMAKSSAYHFYADAQALFAELAVQMDGELLAAMDQPVSRQEYWKDIFDVMFERGIDALEADLAMTKLLLGPQTSFEIKRSDRMHDHVLARAIIAEIRKQFLLPDLLELETLFYRAIEILDLLLSLSVQEEGVITGEARREAHRASHAYLAMYIPQILQRTDAAQRR
ncbi:MULTISPECIES: TetR family transcriptional regulator [Sphingobium]|uniref:TetR family transcriptional regulator n=1 Tax=Sphingobium TaxID=165695 RepID=UPI00159C082F|nr:TetR family transcriptional regulator [Sphingobium sp. 15-1]